jgi:hypothetical protein
VDDLVKSQMELERKDSYVMIEDQEKSINEV